MLVAPAGAANEPLRGLDVPILVTISQRCILHAPGADYPDAMVTVQQRVRVSTTGRGFVNVTREVESVVARSGVTTGLVHVFVRHTSASLVIQENADPAVLRDMLAWRDRVAPENGHYEHDDEGPDDMPAHLKSAITKTSETIPVTGGHLALGTWQAIYLAEHRRAPHARELVITVIGSG